MLKRIEKIKMHGKANFEMLIELETNPKWSDFVLISSFIVCKSNCCPKYQIARCANPSHFLNLDMCDYFKKEFFFYTLFLNQKFILLLYGVIALVGNS